MTTPTSAHGVRAYPSIDMAWQQLADFLGADFDLSLTDYGKCCTFVEDEFNRLGSTFYGQSIGYLYDLTHFHFSAHKDTFFSVVTQAATDFGLQSLGDAGCGVGLDAQALTSLGYDLALYDIESPSTRYAKWRLSRDGHEKTGVRAMDDLGAVRHDLVYAVDVLEHIPDPELFVPRLFAAGRYVCVNFFEHDPLPWDGKDMHFPLDHRSLLPEFSRSGELVQLAASGATITALWKGYG